MISLIPLMGLAQINHGWRIMMYAEREIFSETCLDWLHAAVSTATKFIMVSIFGSYFQALLLWHISGHSSNCTMQCSAQVNFMPLLASKNVNTDSFHDCYRTTLFSAVLKPVYGFKSFHNTLCKMQPHKSIVSANGNSIQFLCVS
jgi:hypothetical protein